MRMMRQLRTWIDSTRGAELEPVTSQEGLEVHAAALRPRFERGHTRVCREIYQFMKIGAVFGAFAEWI